MKDNFISFMKRKDVTYENGSKAEKVTTEIKEGKSHDFGIPHGNKLLWMLKG